MIITEEKDQISLIFSSYKTRHTKANMKIYIAKFFINTPYGNGEDYKTGFKTNYEYSSSF